MTFWKQIHDQRNEITIVDWLSELEFRTASIFPVLAVEIQMENLPQFGASQSRALGVARLDLISDTRNAMIAFVRHRLR
ncbi:hypothetical protein ABIF50_003133 [Bradyrhizobium diazoefficiens]